MRPGRGPRQAGHGGSGDDGPAARCRVRGGGGRDGIRPEKVLSTTRVEAPDGKGTPATVTMIDVSFIGVATQYLARMPRDQELTVFEQNTGDRLRVGFGDAVALHWHPEYVPARARGARTPSAQKDGGRGVRGRWAGQSASWSRPLLPAAPGGALAPLFFVLPIADVARPAFRPRGSWIRATSSPSTSRTSPTRGGLWATVLPVLGLLG